jgi:hypothetical protein
MNKKLCTALHLIYHLLFGSTMYVGANSYLNELRAIRNEIQVQSDKVTDNLRKLKSGVDKGTESFDKLNKAAKKIEKVCRF